ncbi:MAG: NUDIX domain-containing protein [Candidatus Paceibacterota bacterium]|jgi:colanic acid biosynthesis protein WcaH
MNLIPLETYKKIHKNIPILCVDLVILDKKKNFLLVKRANEPAKGKWWFIGGRVNKFETLKKAVARKAKEEIGLKVKILKCLGVDETIFKNGPFGWPTHTINVVFLVELDNKLIKIDYQSKKYEWFSQINNNWPSYIKKFIKLGLVN